MQQQAEEHTAPYVNSAKLPAMLDCMFSVTARKDVLVAAPRIARMLVDAGVAPTAPVNITLPSGGREQKFNTTPLHMATDWIVDKRVMETGPTWSEEQLHALQAIRRRMLQEDAVHGVFWLWPSRDTPPPKQPEVHEKPRQTRSR